MPVNTKSKIADTLCSLVEKKSLDKITVTTLVEVCGISRQTFYYHFVDLMDVVEWTVERELNLSLKKAMHCDSLKDAVYSIVSATFDRQKLFVHLLDSHNNPKVNILLMKAFRTYLRQLFNSQLPNCDIPKEDLTVIIDLYSYGIAGICLEYCQSPDKDREWVANQLYRFLTGQMVPPSIRCSFQ